MTDPTDAELARAKRWAAMSGVSVEKSLLNDSLWFVKDVPSWVNEELDNWIQHDEDAAWSALAIALRPIFASVGPVLFEEAAKAIESTEVSAGLEWARGQFANAIRLRAGEGT